MADALEGASRSQDIGVGGSEVLVTYMLSHCEPEVELFSASVLNEWTGPTEKVGELSELCIKSVQSRGPTVTRASSLMYLCHVIQNASPDIVYREHRKWTTFIQQSIVAGVDLEHCYMVLKSFLSAVKKCPEANREFSTGQLSTLLQTLMSFRRTKSQVTSRSIVACISACLHHYPFIIGQHYAVLHSWAIEGLGSVDTIFSQQCSRLLALLSSDAASSWEKTVHKLCDELSFLTTTAFAPANQQGVNDNASMTSSSMFPLLPISEPRRIATISLYYQSVTRSLVYLLCFRLSASPVSVPLQLMMITISQPFTMLPDRLAGRHALELLLLKSALPIFYSTMFTLLEALIKCAGTHLLPYSTVVNQLFVHALTWTSHSTSYQDLRCRVYHCIGTWLATSKCYGSCDHLVSMVISDTEGLTKESKPSAVIIAPKRKRRKVASEVTASNSELNKSNTNEKLVMAALSAVNSLLQFCGPVMNSTSLEDLEHHMIKSSSHDHHSPSIKIMLLHCALNLINVSCCQYTPPVSWLIAMITRATHSDNDQVRLTALQLLNQCDLTVMSSIVPHPLSTSTPPASQPSTRDKLLENNERPSCSAHNPRLVDDDKAGLRGRDIVEEDQGEVEEVIMIDDVSSNEEVTMEPAVTTGDGSGQVVVTVDGSHNSSHIDLDQDDDSYDLHIALDKFVDQSSDASLTE